MSEAKPRLGVEDITGAWAIIPTPATDDAADWRCEMSVDLEETARIVEGMINAGVDGILSLGTLGECGTLSWAEKRAFIQTLVDTARGRIPVFVGTSSLSTRETIEQTREAYKLGADGTMIGPPMWNKPDVGTAVQFFRDVAEAVPEMAICVYANPYVFKFDFPPPFWAQIADIPQIVCAKTATAGTYLRDLKACQGKIRLMPIDAEYYAAARLDPETALAFWSSSASCGPAPVTALRDLIVQAKQSGNWQEAKALTDKISNAILPTIAFGDFDVFQMHNTTLEKGRMDVAGWLKAGPNRPPHHVVPDRIKELAQRGGESWVTLQNEYAKKESQ